MNSSAVVPANLIERFPVVTAEERAALLAWIRQTPLVYGHWKYFKALYKKAEAPALQPNGEVDVELLGALLARLDAAPIPQNPPHLQLVDAPAAVRGRHNAVASGTVTYTVTGRRDWDWSGWRLTIAQQDSSGETSGLRQRLDMVRRRFGLAPTQTPLRTVWDFNAREYIGDSKTVRLDGTTLRIKGNSGPEFLVDVSDPTFPHFVSQSPSMATWQYMKRRVRRALRETRRKRPELFWPLAVQMLRESGRDALDFGAQWAAVDVLYKHSDRWEQKRAGRGPYTRTSRPMYNRLRREEAAPELWDANLAEVPALYLDERVPLQANVTALKVLWSHAQQAPPLSRAQMARFLDGPVPILKSIATRALVVSWEDGEEVSGSLAAAAFLMAGARVRQRLRALVEKQLANEAVEWRQSFSTQLVKVLDESPHNRRGRTAAIFLAERFPDLISDEALWRHLTLWLSLSRGEEDDWVLARVRQSGARGEVNYLAVIAALPEAQREIVFREFAASVGGPHPSTDEAYRLVGNDDEAVNELGWRYLAASGIRPGSIRDLWQRLLRSYDEPILRPAFGDASALVFESAQWPSADVARWFEGYYTPWDRMCQFAAPNFFDAALTFLPPEQAPRRIFLALARMRPQTAVEVLNRHRDAARDFRPTAQGIRSALTDFYGLQAADATTAMAWQFLAASAVEPATLREVWRELWSQEIPVDAVDAAVYLFERAQIDAGEIEAWLNDNAELAASWAPPFFNAILATVPGATKVLLVLRAEPEQWRQARPSLLHLLNDRALRSAFWHGVFERLREDGGNAENESAELRERILNDSELCATFEQLDKAEIETFFVTTEGAHEPLLLQWLTAHLKELNRDDAALITAATCSLSGVHERALSRIRWIEPDLSLALRLMESSLPPAFELGRGFFQAAATGSDDESTFALALCDSPNAEVRAFGRSFIEARRDSLLRGDLLQNLTENPDPKMQAWLGGQLLQAGDSIQQNVQTRAFDAAVLRTRGRSRRAKETVKQRLSHNREALQEASQKSDIDIATLLETARGSTTRDREWALQQLAALALAGHEIEDVNVTKPD